MSNSDNHAGDHGHGHGSPYIQHHYDDAKHQFDSGKLGIWLFLVQEVLFFSGLFVAYVLYRHHHPEIYAYAHHYLDVKFGAINTAVLIFSSLTAAWAVRCAQLNQKRGLILCLSLTIGCAFAFLGIKYIEYSHKIHEQILFGKRFDPCISPSGKHLLNRHNDCPGSRSTVAFDFEKGQTKASPGCFGPDNDVDALEPGVQLECKVRESKFAPADKDKKEIASRDIPRCPEEGEGEGHAEGDTPEAKAAAKQAKPAPVYPCWEPAVNPNVCPASTAVMVVYGDEDKHNSGIDIKAECEPAPKVTPPADPFADPTVEAKLGTPQVKPIHHKTKHEQNEELANGPPPPNTNMFFSIYFAMTGLHGLHVLFGIFIFIWLLIRAAKGHFNENYFGPIDYAALYWHIVDLIWIFLFPLLYLIH